MISVGQIPENFSITDVFELELAALPTALVGRRALYTELIWDAEGGFQQEWIDGSSVEVHMDTTVTFLLKRRAFSAAGLSLFVVGASSGGAITLSGDVTGLSNANTVVAIQGEAVPTPSTGVLTFNGTDLTWAAGGTGDVVGPASAVTARVATFNGTTGKLIQDGGKTIAQIEASAVTTADTAAVYQALITGNISATSTTWASITGLFTTITDVLQVGISRSGNTFTFTQAGYYVADVGVGVYGASFDHFLNLRLRSSAPATVLKQTSYTAASVATMARCHMHGVFFATAGSSFTLQYVKRNQSGATTASTSDGEAESFGAISFYRIGG